MKKIINRYMHTGKGSFIFLCLLILPWAVSGQPVRIGKKMPELVMNNVINHKAGIIKLSDFKGKLIILDSWGLGCIPCIKAFPKIDSLQKKYSGKVQFILINNESQQKTVDFFEERKHMGIKFPENVPVVTGAKKINDMFKAYTVPHSAWIDSKGVLVYLTNLNAFTEENIDGVIAGKTIKVNNPLEKSKIAIVNPIGEVLKYSDSAGLPGYYSFVATLPPTINLTEAYEQSFKNYYHLSASGSMVQLFTTAFGEGSKSRFEAADLTVLENVDSAKYIREGNKPRFYYYEMALPKQQSKAVYPIMQQELQKAFGVKASVEKRKIKCFIITETDPVDLLKTKGGEPKDNFVIASLKNPTTDSVRMIRNKPFELLVRRLQLWAIYLFDQTKPMVVESSYRGNVDLQIEGSILDKLSFDGLRSYLKKSGLNIIEGEREVDVLVIQQ